MFRALLILILTSVCGAARAHTVPVVVIEAEFSPAREVILKVNLDPRLFLQAVPTSVPAVPASWWFDQDDASKEKTLLQAAEYVSRTLRFSVGETPLTAQWKLQPIDSVSAIPLAPTSAEAHLLAEHRGPLPAVPGDFKVAVDKSCAVAVILLCSTTGDPERRPQSLFPGEMSRAFPLPAIPQPPPPPPAAASPGWLLWIIIGVCVLGLLLGLFLRSSKRSPDDKSAAA